MAAAWRGRLLRAAGGVRVVFVDPDNGIEVPSKPPGRAGSAKFVMWDEIEGLWRMGCSLVVDQHFPREAREVRALHEATTAHATRWMGRVEATHVRA